MPPVQSRAPEPAPWPCCPECGQPASSVHDLNGVRTFECNRHSITQPPVYFNAAGERIEAPPDANPDVQSPRTDIDALLREALDDADRGVIERFDTNESYIAALRDGGTEIHAARREADA